MKKTAILLGGMPDNFIKDAKLFEGIEKKFNCTIKRIGEFEAETQMGDNYVKFFFCYKPRRDKNYLDSAKWYKKTWKSNISPPANEVAKKIKNFDMVIFFGFCGAFNEEKNRVCLPNKFSEIDFEESFIRLKHIDKIKASASIELNNILIGKIKGEKCRTVSSNLTLMPKNIEGNSKEHLKILASNLSKHADVVEMETYTIVKELDGKLPLGVFLFVSDVLDKDKDMLESKAIKFNLEIFKKSCLETIEKFV